MERLIGRFSAHLYAILRIVAGLMFFLHGTQKIFGWPGGSLGQLPMIAIVAGWLEVILGFLITIGLLGSFAAFLASGQMAVAYFKGHAGQGFWPTVNQGELAVLYCFPFLYMAAVGSGIWSVDAVVKKR